MRAKREKRTKRDMARRKLVSEAMGVAANVHGACCSYTRYCCAIKMKIMNRE